MCLRTKTDTKLQRSTSEQWLFGTVGKSCWSGKRAITTDGRYRVDGPMLATRPFEVPGRQKSKRRQGLIVRPKRLLALFDKKMHPHVR